MAYDLEINLPRQGQVPILRLAGAVDRNNLMIVFAHTPALALNLLDELMKINNEQAVFLRIAFKNQMLSIQD